MSNTGKQRPLHALNKLTLLLCNHLRRSIDDFNFASKVGRAPVVPS